MSYRAVVRHRAEVVEIHVLIEGVARVTLDVPKAKWDPIKFYEIVQKHGTVSE